MLRWVLVFGGLGGLLVVLLRWIEYRWLVVAHAGEIYGALVAALFAALGLWLGARFSRSQAATNPPPPPSPALQAGVPFERDEAPARALGLTADTLSRWEARRQGPPCTRIGRKTFYRRAAIQEWIRAQEQAHPVRKTRGRP